MVDCRTSGARRPFSPESRNVSASLSRRLTGGGRMLSGSAPVRSDDARQNQRCHRSLKNPMRLQRKRLPDAGDSGLTHLAMLGQAARRPMGRVAGRRFERRRQRALYMGIGIRSRDTGTRLVEQSVQSPRDKSAAPFADRVLGDMQIASDRRGRRARRIPEHLSMANSKMLRKSAIRHAQACCATHGAIGFRVQPATCTRRLPSSMKNSTYSRCRHIVSTVKKTAASMLRRCARTNSRHVIPPRMPTGPRPAARRQVRTAVAATTMPWPFSSATTR